MRKRGHLVLLAIALLIPLTLLLGACNSEPAEKTEQEAKVIAVKASFPLGGGDVTVTGASVSLEDGSLVEAKIDLPSGTPIAEKMTVRVEKRGDDWVIVEVLD